MSLDEDFGCPAEHLLIFSRFHAPTAAPQMDLKGDIEPQMRECARHAFTAVLSKLNPLRRQWCFELFGLDFMIDADFKVGEATDLTVCFMQIFPGKRPNIEW